MSIFKRLFHSATKDLPIELQDVPAAIQDLYEAVEALRKDQATMNTAIGRIERKQNRWVEILNTKEGGDPEAEKQAAALIRQAEAVGVGRSPGDIIPDNEADYD